MGAVNERVTEEQIRQATKLAQHSDRRLAEARKATAHHKWTYYPLNGSAEEQREAIRESNSPESERVRYHQKKAAQRWARVRQLKTLADVQMLTGDQPEKVECLVRVLRAYEASQDEEGVSLEPTVRRFLRLLEGKK